MCQVSFCPESAQPRRSGGAGARGTSKWDGKEDRADGMGPRWSNPPLRWEKKGEGREGEGGAPKIPYSWPLPPPLPVQHIRGKLGEKKEGCLLLSCSLSQVMCVACGGIQVHRPSSSSFLCAHIT